MEKVLNRGLNFSVLSDKLDITQVLVDWKRFERTMIWKEWWFGKEDENENKEPIFKTRKTNLPKNSQVPIGLKTYLSSVKSEIVDPKNRRHAKCNLPKNEMEALKELVKVQKERKIVIKQCDKGAGILIINFEDYMKAAKDHLEETMEDAEGNKKPYYKKVTETVLKDAKDKIMKVLQSGYNNEIITKQEYEAMCPESKTPSKFYCNFKVHKPHTHIPPVRPIISGSGSILENPSKFVDFHLKHIATKHKSYIQDTPDFIRKVEEINNKGELPINAIIVTIDVKALYTNIPQKEGTLSAEEALNERENMQVPTEYIISLLKLILENNIFTFSENLYSQVEGTSMGPRHSPHYADIFMARKIDSQISEIFQKYETQSFDFMKRFLDDIFKIFVGSTADLHKIFEEMNLVHPSIKFTMSHTSNNKEPNHLKCSCPPQDCIPFLDTSCQIRDGRIMLDLHKKDTDKNMYLLPSSCHPPHQHENVPFSLAMRIVRICSLQESREKRFSELKQMFLDRGYRESIVEASIHKARNIPRNIALRKVVNPVSSKRPVAVVSWDPRLPSIDTIQQKHWRSMAQDPYLKKVFPEAPLVAYRRQRNLREILIRAKLPPPNQMRNQRQVKGMKRCQKNCLICPYIKEGRDISEKEFTWKINQRISCQSNNLVYMIICTKENCQHKFKIQQKYIGETERKLKDRICEHIGYINTKKTEQATGQHFNLPGHSLSDMKVTVLEQVFKSDPEYRKERESYLIRKFNTYYQGMNRKP